MAKPPRSPRPIKRATNVKDSTVRGRALKAAKGAGMRPELLDEPLPSILGQENAPERVMLEGGPSQ